MHPPTSYISPLSTRNPGHVEATPERKKSAPSLITIFLAYIVLTTPVETRRTFVFSIRGDATRRTVATPARNIITFLCYPNWFVICLSWNSVGNVVSYGKSLYFLISTNSIKNERRLSGNWTKYLSDNIGFQNRLSIEHTELLEY